MNKSKFSLDVESINGTGNLSNKIDKEALQAFAKGALEHDASNKKISPWQNEDPYALPDYNFRLRLNKSKLTLYYFLSRVKMAIAAVAAYNHLGVLTLVGKPSCRLYLLFVLKKPKPKMHS